MNKIKKTISLGLLLLSLTSCDIIKPIVKTSENSSTEVGSTSGQSPKSEEVKSEEATSEKIPVISLGSNTRSENTSITHSSEYQYIPTESDNKYAKKEYYGTREERAISSINRISRVLSPADEKGNVKKRPLLRPNKGIYQVAGLSGYFRYEEFETRDFNKGLEETVNRFSSVMYSLLLSGEDIDFNGVTFLSQAGKISSGTRIDELGDCNYMITTKNEIEFVGIYNDIEYYMTYNLQYNTFRIEGRDFALSYYESSKNIAEEMDTMVNYISSIDDLVFPEIFIFFYENFYDGSKILDRESFLSQNVNDSVRTRPFKNEYYSELATIGDYNGNGECRFTISDDGTLTNIEGGYYGMTLVIPEGVKKIGSFDSYQNYYHKISSIYLPSSVEEISDTAAKTMSASVIFCDWNMDES